jgi:hypothetical protein
MGEQVTLPGDLAVLLVVDRDRLVAAMERPAPVV